jgi:very-short-patch-repair endonuclease
MSPRVRLPGTILKRLEAEGRLDALGVAVARVAAAPARDREDWPGALAVQCVRAGLPDPVRELRFHPVRRWRFDLAFPDALVAVEVDGGSWVGGRHTSGVGFEGDCVKVSEAAALGWRVLRVTPRHVTSGEALGWVERALAWAPP